METCDAPPTKPGKSFAPWTWQPLLLGVVSLAGMMAIPRSRAGEAAEWTVTAVFGVCLFYFLIRLIARLIGKQWRQALWAFLCLASLAALFIATVFITIALSFFGPSEDHFADHLLIPSGIEIASPVADDAGRHGQPEPEGTDDMQAGVKRALQKPGGNDSSFIPSVPSLREAATRHAAAFQEYIEASPDWHVFLEQGNRFASRRWSYGGEPRDTLHGYISEFGTPDGFQTRALLCLDRKPWSSYEVQHVQEGGTKCQPDMSEGNKMNESRVMIECGGVWLEVFEQSHALERRVTAATLGQLEKEFSEFLGDTGLAVAHAKDRSRTLAKKRAGAGDEPFRLLEGAQPGMYGVDYALNPGEPGVVYLKACEITKGTWLSEESLKSASAMRMIWSTDPTEKFGAKSGIMIYEGDWGKPYAARFEVWFKPDSGKTERKLAERIFKIEGWQR